MTHSPFRTRLTAEPLDERVVPALAGDLDPTFGSGGRVVTQIPVSAFTSNEAPLLGPKTAALAAAQPDGKVVVAFTIVGDRGNKDFAAIRLNPDGSQDPSFGINGLTVEAFDQGTNNDDIVTGIAVAPDGKIVIVGIVNTGAGAESAFGVVRLNQDGKIDAGFGFQGKSTFDFLGNASTLELPTAVAVGADGSVVVAGSVLSAGDNDFGVAKLTPTGQLDPSFNRVGLALIDFRSRSFSNNDTPTAVAIGADGSVYVGGTIFRSNGTGDFGVAKLTPAGAPDPSFGGDAKQFVPIDLGGTNDDAAMALALGADGSVFLAGFAEVVGTTRADLVVVKLTPAGDRDQSFGFNGVSTAFYNLNGQSAAVLPVGMAVLPGGRVVVGSGAINSTGTAFTVTAFAPNGALDATYNDDGLSLIDITPGASALPSGFTVLPDGRLVLTGAVGGKMLAVRYLAQDDPVVSPPPPPAAPVLAGGSPAGTAVEYTVSGGQLAAGRTITFPGLAGVVHTATADVNGDGTPDYVGAASEGQPGRVVVLSGTDLSVLADEFPYGTGFTGGINVAAADFDGDGFADVAVAPDHPTSFGAVAPEVIVFSGADKSILARFLGLNDPTGNGADPGFKGGLRLGAGDVNGDGTPDLLVGAGTGGGPRITVWSGKGFAGGGQPTVNPLINLFVFESGQRGGAYIAAGDLNADGIGDMVFGGGPGGSTRIRSVDGRLLFGLPADQLRALDLDQSASFPAGLLRDNFFAAGDAAFRGGVRLTTRDVDSDGKADIVTGSGDGAAGQVRVYTAPLLDAARGARDPASQDPLAPFGADVLAAGVFVG